MNRTASLLGEVTLPLILSPAFWNLIEHSVPGKDFHIVQSIATQRETNKKEELHSYGTFCSLFSHNHMPLLGSPRWLKLLHPFLTLPNNTDIQQISFHHWWGRGFAESKHHKTVFFPHPQFGTSLVMVTVTLHIQALPFQYVWRYVENRPRYINDAPAFWCNPEVPKHWLKQFCLKAEQKVV